MRQTYTCLEQHDIGNLGSMNWCDHFVRATWELVLRNLSHRSHCFDFPLNALWKAIKIRIPCRRNTRRRICKEKIIYDASHAQVRVSFKAVMYWSTYRTSNEHESSIEIDTVNLIEYYIYIMKRKCFQ